MNIKAVKHVNKIKVKNTALSRMQDRVVVEAPLQIELIFIDCLRNVVIESIASYAIMMRTPGDDQVLIIGLLYGQGVIKSIDDVIEICRDEHEDSKENHWLVSLKSDCLSRAKSSQSTHTSYSSCGICGTSFIKALEIKGSHAVDNDTHWLSINTIHRMVSGLSSRQDIFSQTGGTHCAALFNQEGKPIALYEDIGRHNALDKLLGSRQTFNNAHGKDVVVLSSRISYEMVQKVIVSGISVLIAIGAPSVLAIQAAQRFNITVIAFARDNSFSIYHGESRLTDK
ncbi:formate dehydrogenase accessory sulfurtransferase FdhD [Thalassotalea sediminis]|uniref:formate dehydrogenase accessory sulfurtransferase FdhD n=1 Tax=Thalassotalea sediminis TaxID=1759089 RepID=UPI002573E939|nr:formate dehydrogenase accessory sulfurtransferase FdhD [Thalassotalea sediminis]